MNIEALISKAAGDAVKALYGMDATEKMLQLQKTRSEFEGNLTLVVFPFVKAAKKSPEQTAQEIGEYLQNNCSAVEKFNVVKGFLNLSVGSGAWLELLKVIDADEHFGMKLATEDSPLVMIEYSSPNTNKPLHLGHVRNNLLGWSLAQIMEANGNKVVKTNIVNDRGIHICKSMLAWLKYGNGETPESSGKKGDHLIGSRGSERARGSGHGRGEGQTGGTAHQGSPRDAREVGAERPGSARPVGEDEQLGVCRLR